jgi:hypothetical protein
MGLDVAQQRMPFAEGRPRVEEFVRTVMPEFTG